MGNYVAAAAAAEENQNAAYCEDYRSEEICQVCKNPLEEDDDCDLPIDLPCGHTFHADCVLTSDSLLLFTNCPTCDIGIRGWSGTSTCMRCPGLISGCMTNRVLCDGCERYIFEEDRSPDSGFNLNNDQYQQEEPSNCSRADISEEDVRTDGSGSAASSTYRKRSSMKEPPPELCERYMRYDGDVPGSVTDPRTRQAERAQVFQDKLNMWTMHGTVIP